MTPQSIRKAEKALDAAIAARKQRRDEWYIATSHGSAARQGVAWSRLKAAEIRQDRAWERLKAAHGLLGFEVQAIVVEEVP